MQYKVGDEVFIKAEITDVHPGSERPYFVQPCYDSVNWVSKNKLYRCDGNYEQGLADAWELARKLYCEHNDSERREILGIAQYETVLECMTYEEVITKIEAHKQNNKFEVGDVVSSGFAKGVVARAEGENLFVVWSDGSCGEDGEPKTLYKTGKHIDIESLLRQIGE